jgi:ABC-type molybdate transport system permease subunit
MIIMDKRRSTIQAPLLAVVLVALLLAMYVSGFYLLGSIGTAGPVRFHVYKSPWLSHLFEPAATVESWLLGCEVYSAHTEEP